jgi:hypothetical protein
MNPGSHYYARWGDDSLVRAPSKSAHYGASVSWVACLNLLLLLVVPNVLGGANFCSRIRPKFNDQKCHISKMCRKGSKLAKKLNNLFPEGLVWEMEDSSG